MESLTITEIGRLAAIRKQVKKSTDPRYVADVTLLLDILENAEVEIADERAQKEQYREWVLELQQHP